MANEKRRLIDANALRLAIRDDAEIVGKHYARIKMHINGAPTVDAVEVVHGRWSFGKNHGDFVEAECTACGGLLLVKWYDEIDKYRYCPNCGAKMDGEAVNED